MFETERMTLRMVRPDDLEYFYEMLSDPETMRYFPQTYSREESMQWVERILSEYATYGYSRWACHLKNGGDFVGICGLKYQENIDGVDEIEVGYTFNRRFWNKGLATEAARATMDYAREMLGMTRLISLIRPENLPSRRVAEKNGLVPEKEVLYKGYVHIVYVSS
jgi:RimJ/RimL family protein N-acetyltransferase